MTDVIFLRIWCLLNTWVWLSGGIENTFFSVITIWLTIINTCSIHTPLILGTKYPYESILSIIVTWSSSIVTISIYTNLIGSTGRWTVSRWGTCWGVFRSIYTNIIRRAFEKLLLTPFSFCLTIITIGIDCTLIACCKSIPVTILIFRTSTFPSIITFLSNAILSIIPTTSQNKLSEIYMNRCSIHKNYVTHSLNINGLIFDSWIWLN